MYRERFTGASCFRTDDSITESRPRAPIDRYFVASIRFRRGAFYAQVDARDFSIVEKASILPSVFTII